MCVRRSSNACRFGSGLVSSAPKPRSDNDGLELLEGALGRLLGGVSCLFCGGGGGVCWFCCPVEEFWFAPLCCAQTTGDIAVTKSETARVQMAARSIAIAPMSPESQSNVNPTKGVRGRSRIYRISFDADPQTFAVCQREIFSGPT